MDFLREKLTVTAADPGLSETFFADLLQPRPDFDTLVAFAVWSATVQQEMATVKTRKNCPVAWVGLFVDQVCCQSSCIMRTRCSFALQRWRPGR